MLDSEHENPELIWNETTRNKVARFIQEECDKLFQVRFHSFIHAFIYPPFLLSFDSSSRQSSMYSPFLYPYMIFSIIDTQFRSSLVLPSFILTHCIDFVFFKYVFIIHVELDLSFHKYLVFLILKLNFSI